MSHRILFARLADAANVNAQCKNTQAIAARWRSAEYRPSVLAYGEPSAAVAGNPNVDLVQLRRGRAWRVDLIAKYLRRFAGIFYPGVHHGADWLALRARFLSRRTIPVVATIEGLAGSADGKDDRRRIADIAGHAVHCQTVAPGTFRRGEAILRMADHIVAISPFLGRVATGLYGDKVSVLPLGVDVSLFRRSQWTRRARPRVVSAGNLAAHKRPETFVELARLFPKGDFVWFGGGTADEREAVFAAIRQARVTNVAFPGPVAPERLAREFAASDVFVLPALGEGVPKVTQEAAACGLAQIIFGFYEAPTVVNGENGFVVWSDDELIARLGRLLGDPDLVERMGRKGVELAQDWSWEWLAPFWEQRIIDVVEGRITKAHLSEVRQRAVRA